MDKEQKKIDRRLLLTSIIIGICVSNALVFNFSTGKIDGYSFQAVVFTIAMIIATFFCMKQLKHSLYKKNALVIIVSIMFGLVNVASLCMYYKDHLVMFENFKWMIICVYLALCYGMIAYVLINFLFMMLDRNELVERKEKTINENVSSKISIWISKHTFLFAFLVIIICWAPWVILYYPASADYDVFAQLNSYFSLNGVVPNNHHPWFASVVLGNFYKIGFAVGDENIGIFLYIVFRDIILAAIYALCVTRIKKMGAKRGIYYLILAFYAITPVWGAYAKHAFKDTFATGLFCLYVLTLVDSIVQINRKQFTIKKAMILNLSALIVSLFRNNCFYVVAPTLILLCVWMATQKVRPIILIIVLCSLVSYSGYNSYITNVKGIESGRVDEALSIPYQQVARTVRDHDDTLTAKEKKAIDGYFIYKQLGDYYDPLLSDPVKNACTRYDKKEGASATFVKTWISLFFKYPKSYVEAALAQSYGYYAFTPNQAEHAGNYNCGMTVFYWNESGNSESYHLSYPNITETPRTMLNQWVYTWDSIPILNLTDMCAFYTWLVISIGAYFIIKKRWIYLLPVFGILLMVLTCVASPVNDCFRYFAPVAASTPALIIFLCRCQKKK